METTTRNASMEDLAAMLMDQQVRKHDLVVSASMLRSEVADLVVTGSEPVLTMDGVTVTDGRYRPTNVADEGIAEKLGIPTAYLRRLRTTRPDLYDANVNGWLRDPAEERSFMLRTFKPDAADQPGIARAVLSDRYARIDHLDALTAALAGVREADADVRITSADLTDRRMVVRVQSDSVKALAPTLLRGYRSPWNGASGDDNPTVFAGFEIANSETGGGAFTITPRLVVEVCTNGMKMTKDALRAVHLGGKMDDGVIRWSADTQDKQLALISAKTADAVRTFLDVEYMERTIGRLEAEAGKPVETVDQVRDLAKALTFSKEQIDGVLGHFIRGGQMTRGGVMNAITAYAQEVPDGDTAYEMENRAVAVLTV